MSTIQSHFTIVHAESGLNVSSVVQRDAFEQGFSSSSVSVNTTQEAVLLGDLITPRQVCLKLISGSPLQVGLSSGVYPLRLSEPDESMTLQLDVEGLRQISTITTVADSSNSLARKYFDVTYRGGSIARFWFQNPGAAEVSRVVVNSVTGIGGKYFDLQGGGTNYRVWINTGSNVSAPTPDGRTLVPVPVGTPEVTQITMSQVDGSSSSYFDLYDHAGPVRVWVNWDGAGTAPPTPAGGRLRPATVLSTHTLAQAVAAISSAIDADPHFSSVSDGVDTITITSASAGDKTDAEVPPASSTWFSAVTTQQGSLFVSDVTTALVTALDALTPLTAVASGLNTVNITDTTFGVRTDIAAGPSSGPNWTLTTVTQGFPTTLAPDAPTLPVGAPPTAVGRLVPVTFTAGDTATAMAINIALAVDEDAEFIATSSGSVVTITDQHTGTRTAISTGNSTMTADTLQPGSASPTVYLKSTGVSQVVVVVAPN